MNILALEENPKRAATLRHIVCDRVGAQLTLVASTEEALASLRTSTPAVILLPPLLGPSDEAELLRSLPDGTCVEVLFTPVWKSDADSKTARTRTWRLWGRTQASTTDDSELRLFADRLAASLKYVRDERELADSYRLEALDDVVAGAEPAPVDDPVAESSAAPVETLALVPLGPGHVPSVVNRAPADPEPCAEPERGAPGDRRRHQRFPVHLFRGLRAARIEHGPDVSVLDLSVGGALLESETALRPDTDAVLELVADRGTLVVPIRVLRCQVTALDGRARYRAACAFLVIPQLADLVPSDQRSSDAACPRPRVDIAVKTFVERHLHDTPFGGRLTDLLPSLERTLGRDDSDPGHQAVRELIADLRPAAGEPRAVPFTTIEMHLERAISGVHARFGGDPQPARDPGVETIYFNLPAIGPSAPRETLTVQITRGVILEDWQFRLLKASTWLAALSRTGSPAGDGGLVACQPPDVYAVAGLAEPAAAH